MSSSSSSSSIEMMMMKDSTWVLMRTESCLADHEMNDLEDLLDEVLQVDFNVQAEDDSPYMVRL